MSYNTSAPQHHKSRTYAFDILVHKGERGMQISLAERRTVLGRALQPSGHTGGTGSILRLTSLSVKQSHLRITRRVWNGFTG